MPNGMRSSCGAVLEYSQNGQFAADDGHRQLQALVT